MPKKKPGPGGRAAKEEQQGKRVSEDRTFGMKNKNKSKKVQNFIRSVKQEQKDQRNERSGGAIESAERAALKEEKKQAELRLLFKAAPKSKAERQREKVAKVAAATGPKRQAKSNKIDLYSDPRGEQRKQETNASWDMNKLQSVVSAKGDGTKFVEGTDIVCKHFLAAVEKGLYGWFWKCEAGPECKYKHSLPPGFVLKKKKSDDDEDEDDNGPSLEEIIEEKRAQLSAEGTPVTLKTFNEWKQCKLAEKAIAKEEKKVEKTKGLTKAQKAMGLGMSGRELFDFQPDMFVDDEEAGGGDDEIEAFKKVGAFEVEAPEPEPDTGDSLFDESDSLFDDEDSLFNDEDQAPSDPLEMAKEKVFVAGQMENEGELAAALSMLASALADFGGSRPKLEARMEALKVLIAEQDALDIDEDLFDMGSDMSDDSDEDDDAPKAKPPNNIFLCQSIKVDESLFDDDASGSDDEESEDEADVDETLFESGSGSDEDLSEFID